MGNEVWKKIKGYEGIYDCSNFGRIKSLKNKIILKGGFDKSGYHIVSLSKNKKQETRTVHRLIALSFIKNPENKRTVNHKNGVKSDNRLINLEWNTYSENHLHAFKTGLNKPTRMVALIQLDKNNNYINSYLSISNASKGTGISKSQIWKCVNDKIMLTKGFKFIKQLK